MSRRHHSSNQPQHKTVYRWVPINSPHPFPGVRLLSDGRLQIGTLFCTQQLGYDQGINGISVRKQPAEGQPFRLETAGRIRLYRFHAGKWEASLEILEPQPSLDDRVVDMTFFVGAYLFYPGIYGALAARRWYAMSADNSVLLAAFATAAAAGLFCNDVYYRWGRWGNQPPKGRCLAVALGAILGRMLLFNALPLLWCLGISFLEVEPGPHTQPSIENACASALGATLAAWPLGVLMYAGWHVARTKRATQQPEVSLTGRAVASAVAVRRQQQQLVPDGSKPAAAWGGLLLPIDRSFGHVACVGITRSGKTTILRLFMQSILPWMFAAIFAKSLRGRAVVFDAKSEFVPILRGMGLPAESILVMHPLDKRCVPLDIAADTRTKAECVGTATIFIPERKGENRFFIEASRDIFAHCMWALQLSHGTDWTFRDLMLILSDFTKVEKLLDQHEETRHIIPSYCGNRETYANVIATLRAFICSFETVAACWHHSTNKPVSIEQWVHSNSVLVLGHDDGKAEMLQTLNRWIVRKTANVLLAPGRSVDPERDRTWLILDEARDLGKLPGVRELLTRGAGKGCSVALGFQSVMGMKEVFGQNEASEIVGQCENIAISSLCNDQDTAEWAAKLIGRYEKRELTHTHTFSPRSGETKGTSESIQERYFVRPETLQAMPYTNPQNGLQGYFLSKTYGVVDASQFGISGDELFGRLLDPADSKAVGFIPAPADWHVLLPWTAEERAKFAFLFVDQEELPAWLWQVAHD